MPSDLQKALDKNETALENFSNFSLYGRRLYVSWLNSAKRDETRMRRIKKIVQLSEKNIPPGMM